MGFWCINVSLGAKGTRGRGSYVGLFYYEYSFIHILYSSRSKFIQEEGVSKLCSEINFLLIRQSLAGNI